MKIQQLIFIILIIGLYSCDSKKDEIRIIGKIDGEIPDKVEYTLPINGVCSFAFRESVQPDSMGNFTIILNIEKPSFVKLLIPGQTKGTLLAEKGMEYVVNFDLESNDNKFMVVSDNQKGQNIYNSLPNPGLIEFEANEFSKDSVASDIIEKLSKIKENELLKFKELLSNEEISENFYRLVQLDRDCYYSALQGYIALFKKLEDDRKNNGVFTDEIKKMWQESFEKSSPTNISLLSSPWYYSLANNFRFYKENTDDSLTLKKHQNDLIHTQNIENAKKILSSSTLEYYSAYYLFNACLQGKYEKELISLFDAFKSDFPTSRYTKFIEPMVALIVEFQKKKEEPFKEKFKFIEGYEMKNSLSVTVISLKGKKVYIDVWATWCGPCKEEFKHKSGLKKLLAENNIELMYISMDKDENDTQWKDMIKYYELEGYHIRVNKELDSYLRELYGQNGRIMIPWYILIDENGKIIKRHASRPSQLKELGEELNMM